MLCASAMLYFVSISCVIQFAKIYQETRDHRNSKPKLFNVGKNASSVEYWKYYQFGDIMYNKGRYYNEISQEYDELFTVDYICGNWPDSIACEFRTSETLNVDELRKKHVNISRLVDICVRRSHEENIDTQQIDTVIHVRLGDTVRGPRCWETQCNPYILPVVRYSRLKNVLEVNTSIVLVAWEHHIRHHSEQQPESGKNYMNLSQTYLSKMAQYLVSLGFRVTIKSSNFPDSDFLYMCNAKTYIQSSQSGFGKIIREVVSKRGNVVYKIGCFDVKSWILGLWDVISRPGEYHIRTHFDTIGFFDSACYF